jgi:hypothetical protein
MGHSSLLRRGVKTCALLLSDRCCSRTLWLAPDHVY